MASSAPGVFTLSVGQLSGCDAGQVPGGGAAADTFRGLVSPMQSSSSSEESDTTSEGSACDDVNNRDSAESLVQDEIPSANVTVQALRFNPEASPFALDEGPSFSVQEQGFSVQEQGTTQLSVRAHDKQLVKMLTAAIMKHGCPMEIAACKAALCAPWVPGRHANIARLNQAGVWHNGRCTGGLLKWLTKHKTKCSHQSSPTEIFVFSVSLSDFGHTSIYKYMAQNSLGGSPVTEVDRMRVKSLRAVLLASGQPADMRACKSALYGLKHCNRNIEGGLLTWLSRFPEVFVISVSLSGPALEAEETKKLKAEAKQLKAFRQRIALQSQPPAECGLEVPAAEALIHRLSSGDVAELVQSVTRLQQLLASDAALRGDLRCVVAVDCEGVPQALHLIQLAYFTAEGVKRVIVVDGVALGEINVTKLLAPLLTSELTVKLFHDLHMDAAAFANIGRLKLVNCIDSQLVMELRHGAPLMGFNKMLQTLDHPTHPSKFAIKRRMDSAETSIFSRRPLSQKLVEYAAMDAILLLSIKDRLWESLGEDDLDKIKKASHIRAQLAASSIGRRRICVDASNHSLASRELIDVFRPQSRVEGDAAILADILLRNDHSVLFLGTAGSGKTTIVREVAQFLAQIHSNVLVVHTSNEIAVDGDAPLRLHGSSARRLPVQCPNDVHSVVIESVQHHSPKVIVIDEIGRSEDVEAARACKMRGVRVIACARGDLRQVVRSTQLKGLVCGSDTVALGDEAAKADAKRRDAPHGSMNTFTTQGTNEPLFDVIVELRCGELNEWRVVMNSADAVDRILDGGDYFVQKRSRDADTGDFFLEFQKE
jgi:hypothetical protein